MATKRKRKSISPEAEVGNRAAFAGLAKVAGKLKGWKPAGEVLTKVRAVPTIFPQFDRATRCGGFPIERITLIHGRSNEGKAQPVDEMILTPTGWFPIGSLKVGDPVIGGDGQPTAVTGVFPQGEKIIYRVEASDGGSTRCCGEHLWLTRTAKELDRGRYKWTPRPNRKQIPTGDEGCGSIKTTAEIAETLNAVHYLPDAPIVDFGTRQPLPIDPYVLGLILGDGSTRSASITFTADDDELHCAVAKWAKWIGDDTSDATYSGKCRTTRIVHNRERFVKWERRGRADVKIGAEFGRWIVLGPSPHHPQRVTCRCKCGSVMDVDKDNLAHGQSFSCGCSGRSKTKALLEALGLYGKRSEHKFVPPQYMIGSPEQRLELLRGLMDTDGNVANKGTDAEFSSASEQLSRAVLFLARSLGGRANVRMRTTPCLPAYRVRFAISTCPFRLERKAAQWVRRKKKIRRRIVKVERVGREECICIRVAAKHSLYITRDFLVTHNTAFAHGVGLSFLEAMFFYGLVDAEFTTPVTWLRNLMGTFTDHPGFVAKRPTSYEETVDAVRELVEAVDAAKKPTKEDKKIVPPILGEETSALVVVDSIRKLVPANFLAKIAKEGASGAKGSIDGYRGRGAMLKAKLNGEWLDELTPMLYRTGTALLIIGREVDKDGADEWDRRKEEDWKLTGGKALVFDSSLVARISRDDWLKDGKDGPVIGERFKVRIWKTKIGGKDHGYVDAFFHTSNGVERAEGFWRSRDVIDLAEMYDVITHTGGSWFKWGTFKKWNGRAAIVRWLDAHPVDLARLEGECREQFKDDTLERQVESIAEPSE